MFAFLESPINIQGYNPRTYGTHDHRYKDRKKTSVQTIKLSTIRIWWQIEQNHPN